MSSKFKKQIIVVNDKMQKGYRYNLSEPTGRNFDKSFNPDLSPKQMLALGIFGGKYMTDCKKEFPKDWFTKAKLSPTIYDVNMNYFGVKASQSLSVWVKNGWIYKDDPRGWFQWYCRYYMGRRIEKEDMRQIKRWRMMVRHVSQLTNSCRPQDLLCRRGQRQALLHWAYDSRKI